MSFGPGFPYLPAFSAPQVKRIVSIPRIYIKFLRSVLKFTSVAAGRSLARGVGRFVVYSTHTNYVFGPIVATELFFFMSILPSFWFISPTNCFFFRISLLAHV